MNGIMNASHFVNLENDVTGTLASLSNNSPRPFKINKSLLKMGLIRGCGFTLPPGTFGLDFIIPVVLDDEKESRRQRYSFIGIQVKTKADSFYSEVVKTAFPSLIEKFLNNDECVNGNHHSGCMTDEEYDEIVENQLTLILCIDRDDFANSFKGNFYAAKPESALYLKRSRLTKENNLESSLPESDSGSSSEEDILEKEGLQKSEIIEKSGKVQRIRKKTYN